MSDPTNLIQRHLALAVVHAAKLTELDDAESDPQTWTAATGGVIANASVALSFIRQLPGGEVAWQAWVKQITRKMTTPLRLIERGKAVLEAREQLLRAERELAEALSAEEAVKPRTAELDVRARRRR